jgi:hypothetical protein
MSLFVAWCVFPAALALVCLGCGLLLEQLSGRRSSGPLVVPAGFAVVVVLGLFTTSAPATASFTVPLVVACAVAGILLSLPWRRGRVDLFAVFAFVGSFLSYGAPVLASGQATFTGYIKLDDTATWFAITDRVMTHGGSLSGLAPSTYSVVLNDYVAHGYPLGTFLPLGIGRTLVGQDVAWVFQPYEAFLAALLALALYVLTTPLLRTRWLRAVGALLASQAALLYAYTLWGGVKEIASSALLALLVAQLGPIRQQATGARALLPPAVTSAAVIGVLSGGGAIWLLPILVGGVVVLGSQRGSPQALRRTAAFVPMALALAAPALVSAGLFLSRASAASVLTSTKERGNLFHPLSNLEFFGIWPSGDFRVSPSRHDVTYVLIVVLVVAAMAGLFYAWRCGAVEFVLYGLGLAIGCASVVAFGSPWIDAKALATASPASVLLGISGAIAIFERGRQVEGTLLGVAIAGGVLWSNVLAYHDVALAPRGQLAELGRIDREFKHQGPTLLNEHSPYGARHFLRDMDTESPSERRARYVALRSGGKLRAGEAADLDQFRLGALLLYRTLVTRRSGTSSRPPSIYQLVWVGRYYEVWQRPDPAPDRIVEHVPLGSRKQPASTPRCSEVLRLGTKAGRGGVLATVQRPAVITLELSQTPYAEQRPYTEDTRVVYLRRKAVFDYTVHVSAAGRYRVWLGGSFLSRLELSVDGKSVATRRHELNWPGDFTPMGDVQLTTGQHDVTVAYGGPDLHAGSSGNPPFGTGPVVLSPVTAESPVTYVPTARARSLCGKRLDWIEAIRG